MRLRKPLLAILLLLTVLDLAACSTNLLKKNSSSNFKEQLYIDARLNFAIKHPLDWQRQIIPVSNPAYRADMVIWTIEELQQQSDGSGKFLIRSVPEDANRTLPDLLSEFLSSMPELKTGQVEKVDLPAGKALRLLGHDKDRGRLAIALKGRQRDFIISLDYPTQRFDELLPVFEEIVASFTEISRPASPP